MRSKSPKNLVLQLLFNEVNRYMFVTAQPHFRYDTLRHGNWIWFYLILPSFLTTLSFFL